MKSKRVCIIGAGCSGLTAIKCCLEEGLVPVCFERDGNIGGLWNYTDEPIQGKGSIYKNLVINTSKEMMAFSDFPTPDEFPPFMPHGDVLKYFRLYAENFDLLRHIVFKTEVLFISKAVDYDITGCWQIKYQTNGFQPVSEIFDAVLVCSGHHTVPHLPYFKGIEKFEGTKIHSHAYRDASKFKDQKVVVVGIGNSAVDIAVDLCRVTKQVYCSTRRGAWLISKTGVWGIPADLIANNRFLFSLPKSIISWVVERQADFRIDHKRCGLKPTHGVLEAHPTITDEMPFYLMSGKIRIKPNTLEFTSDGVIFEDGSFEHVDTVIFATGYDYQLKFVDEDVLKIEDNKVDLYQYVFPPHLKHPTFGIIGLIQVIGALMPVSEMQCRWFAQLLKGNVQLPNKETMLNDIKDNFNEVHDRYISTRRHTIQAFWVDYMDQIASLIDCKPNFWKMAIKDPEMAFRCHFGPCVPAQFRLQGPHKWAGARDIIKNSVSRAANFNTSNKQSFTTTNSLKSLKSEHSKLMTLILVLLVFIAWFTKIVVSNV